MSNLRPRFSMPRVGRVITCFVAGALLLAACSAADDATAGDTTDGSNGESAADGSGQDGAGGTDAEELSFGDPADVGFEPVEDVEQDPVPLPTQAGQDLPGPDEIIAGIADQLSRPVDGDEILDTVDVVDNGTEAATERDGRSRNSSGELAVLDEAANLACAHVEIALSQLDDGQDSIAIERIWQAADRAGASEIAAVREWQEPLAAVIAGGEVADLAPLIGFITVCAEGGYEL